MKCIACLGLKLAGTCREDARRGWEMRKSKWWIYVKGLKKFQIRINHDKSGSFVSSWFIMFPPCFCMFLPCFVCICFLSQKLVDICQQIFVNARYSGLCLCHIWSQEITTYRNQLLKLERPLSRKPGCKPRLEKSRAKSLGVHCGFCQWRCPWKRPFTVWQKFSLVKNLRWFSTQTPPFGTACLTLMKPFLGLFGRSSS